MDRQETDELPLTGIRVIDVATVIAGPYCAALLGEFGAEVLKVEHPVGGDACRNFGTPTHCGDTLTWLSEARNKKSVTIDLHRPEGVKLFKALAAKDPQTGELMTEAEVRDNVITFIFGGQETTSSALTWAIYLLSQSPEWRERVAAEGEPGAVGAA